ncbi:MAG: 5'-methylthioadenosine/S-adenosylhomocysteine nucleosidase, partial [Acetatifactor sp.]|nr:5'-methylthioadenosine/S-adenosylhomocysteine nucleosidase [Acetatifactor sp.]
MSKTGIIGAMELEVETLKSQMTVSRIVKKAGMEFFEGSLNGAQAVIVRSGVGKVNAALCVQILVDLFEVTHIINTGVAGSLNAKLDIGDILISRDALHHDVDATIFGYKPGEVPQLGIREFPADERLMQLAKAS